MECPYCAGTMQPDNSVSYWVVEGLRTADWMRCDACDHACIQSSRPEPGSMSHERTAERACA
jgi:hypothetical protein